jgi:hypothetical protein
MVKSKVLKLSVSLVITLAVIGATVAAVAINGGDGTGGDYHCQSDPK